jgi:hypothetical protein
MATPDANLLVRTWLLTPFLAIDGEGVTNPVLDLIGPDRVWAGALPEGFDPGAGPGITVVRGGSGMTSGGRPNPEIPDLVSAHVQIRVWAELNEFQVANTIYLAIREWMHARNNIVFEDIGYLMQSVEVVEGMDVRDPETGFATVICFFDLLLHN